MLGSCSKSSPQPAAEMVNTPAELSESRRIASVDVVRAAAAPTEIVAPGLAQIDVHLLIQPGYHVNANPPTYSYLKATELEIAPGEGISVGSIYYPKPLNKKFPFAEKPLAVYEGETDLMATLKAAESAPKGRQSLLAKLRIQACDDQVCYAPGTLDFTIPLTIK
jgi:DsbC/DsbD-like thiol-disulfide interchange protein